MKRTLLFLVLWLAIGFSVGTATLLGPVRWVTAVCRSRDLPESVEKTAVKILIVLLVGLTAAAARILARAAASPSARFETRYGLPALALAAAGSAVWLWMTPAMLHAQEGGETTTGTRFTFGPYPDEDRMGDLAGEGYTAVISLLHPAVIPFEPQLLAREDAAAARAGIQVIHLPMLPWVSDNSAALDRVRALVRSGTGRYYVHCYLGMDRVQMVRRVVEEEGAGAQTEALSDAPALARSDRWEGGEVIHLDERVNVTPYPSDSEFLRFLVGGRVGIVSLMDGSDPDDRPWLEKERGIAAQYRVPFTNLPLSGRRFDPQAVLAAARSVRGMRGTIDVHDFLPVSSGKAPVVEGFLQAYRTGRPPLPPSLFVERLVGGAARVIAPHVATGPRPEPFEFGAVLAARGVRAAIFLGDPRSRAARVDRAAAAEGRIAWDALDAPDPENVVAKLEHGGPFYLYGAVADDLTRAITDRFGPALPTQVGLEAERLFAAMPAAPRPPAMPSAPETPRPRASNAPRRASEAATPSLAGVASPDGASPGAAPSGASSRDEAAPDKATTRARPSAIARFIPSLEMIILLGPILLLFSGAAAWLAGWMRIARRMPVAYSRKGFHFLIFTMAGVLQAAGGLPAVMLFGGLVSLIVLYAVTRGEGFPFYEALARPDDAPRRTLFVLVPLATTALGGLLANLLFGASAIVGYLVGGWGDAVGEPVGRAFGRHRYRVPSLGGVPAVRSLEGSAAVLIAGILAATTGLLLRGVHPAAALGVGAACGAAGAVVEAFSTHGVDNLTVQIAASGAAFFLLS